MSFLFHKKICYLNDIVKKITKGFMQKYILRFAGRNPKTAGVCLGKNWKRLV